MTETRTAGNYESLQVYMRVSSAKCDVPYSRAMVGQPDCWQLRDRMITQAVAALHFEEMARLVAVRNMRYLV